MTVSAILSEKKITVLTSSIFFNFQ